MNNGWTLKTGTATGSYVKVELGLNAKHLKVRGDVTISFDGKEDNLKTVAADNLVNFADVNKGILFVKGSGAYEITAWDGN